MDQLKRKLVEKFFKDKFEVYGGYFTLGDFYSVLKDEIGLDDEECGEVYEICRNSNYINYLSDDYGREYFIGVKYECLKCFVDEIVNSSLEVSKSDDIWHQWVKNGKISETLITFYERHGYGK